MAPDITVSAKTLKALDDLGVPYTPVQSQIVEPPQPQLVEHQTGDYIRFPEGFAGGRNDGLTVSPRRVAYEPDIEEIEREWGRKLRDTSDDSLGNPFIGRINWQEAVDLNLARGECSLSPAQGADFLNLLSQAKNGGIDIHSASGKKLDKKYLKQIFNDMVKAKSLWRAEYFDGASEQREDGLYILTKNKTHKERLRGGLRENKTPGINLESWTQDPTKQGLPRRDILEGDLYYWAPVDKSVARLVAVSGGTSLSYDGDPAYLDGSLGIRAALQLE